MYVLVERERMKRADSERRENDLIWIASPMQRDGVNRMS